MNCRKYLIFLSLITLLSGHAIADVKPERMQQFVGEYELIEGDQDCREHFTVEASEHGISFNVPHGIIWYDSINNFYSTQWTESLRSKVCYKAVLDSNDLRLREFRGGGVIIAPCSLLTKKTREMKLNPENNQLEYMYGEDKYEETPLRCLYEKI